MWCTNICHSRPRDLVIQVPMQASKSRHQQCATWDGILATAPMLSPERIHDVFSRIQKFSSADEVEAIVAGGRSALTRFANNTIHQNVAEEGYVISVRVALDGKTARATTNRLDDESLKRAVQSAEQIARVQESDLDLLPVPDSADAGAETNVQRHFGATAAIKPEDRAVAVEQIVGVAKQHKQTTAGVYSSSESMEAL